MGVQYRRVIEEGRIKLGLRNKEDLGEKIKGWHSRQRNSIGKGTEVLKCEQTLMESLEWQPRAALERQWDWVKAPVGELGVEPRKPC